MRQPSILWVVLSIGLVATASGKDFPLTFKTIPVQDLASFPTGYGRMGQVQVKPSLAPTSEPQATSSHPLYGQIGRKEEPPVLLFRLDESKGAGKGYDTLILDLNGNNDLTDDPVIRPASGYEVPKGLPSEREQALFGPIEMPEGNKIGRWRPVYYAELMIYNKEGIAAADDSRNYIGYLRMKAGCYWEATVELEGARHKLGLVDADSNLRLGEPWKAFNFQSGNEDNWYFRPCDNFLIDADGSGQYDDHVFVGEYCSFGPLVYLGGTACRVALAENGQSIQVTPWTEAMAEISLEPEGEQVRQVSLAWEIEPDQWQLIQPQVVNGKAKVPPGNYRLYGCILEGKSFWRKSVMASAYHRVVVKPVPVKVGQANPLPCGAPLTLVIDAEKGPPQPWELSLSERESAKDIQMLRINTQVVGAGKEIYSGYGRGKDYQDDPEKPTFRVVDSQGKLLVKGNLEFG